MRNEPVKIGAEEILLNQILGARLVALLQETASQWSCGAPYYLLLILARARRFLFILDRILAFVNRNRPQRLYCIAISMFIICLKRQQIPG
jgi:hypothetical protein